MDKMIKKQDKNSAFLLIFQLKTNKTQEITIVNRDMNNNMNPMLFNYKCNDY